ncbi:UNVERIFIED_ORG: hypothetical protein M2328_006112 [Rhodococcus erythropolis]
MALHFPLMINGHTIGHFAAVRKSGGMDPDDMNTYEVEVRKHPLGGAVYAPYGETRSFSVEHRYGDGAWALVRKALENIE